MSPKTARRWYKAGVFLSILAVLAGVVSIFTPRLGKSLSFGFTLIGFFAVTRPSWDKEGARRRVLTLSVGVAATELAILLTGLSRD